MADARDAEKAPDAFRTISEVADDLQLPQHVLRFWETRFTQIKPVKRAGGRRFYRPEDVDLLRGIRHLLYTDGFTIKGAQRILKDQGVRHVQDLGVEREVAVMRTARPAREESGEGVTFGGLLGLLPRRRPKGQGETAGDGLPELPDVAELPLPFPDAEADRDLADEPPEPPAALSRAARAEPPAPGRVPGRVPGPAPGRRRDPSFDPAFEAHDRRHVPTEERRARPDEAPHLASHARERIEPVFAPPQRPSRGPAAAVPHSDATRGGSAMPGGVSHPPEFDDPLLPFLDEFPASTVSEPIEARIQRLRAQERSQERSQERNQERAHERLRDGEEPGRPAHLQDHAMRAAPAPGRRDVTVRDPMEAPADGPAHHGDALRPVSHAAAPRPSSQDGPVQERPVQERALQDPPAPLAREPARAWVEPAGPPEEYIPARARRAAAPPLRDEGAAYEEDGAYAYAAQRPDAFHDDTFHDDAMPGDAESEDALFEDDRHEPEASPPWHRRHPPQDESQAREDPRTASRRHDERPAPHRGPPEPARETLDGRLLRDGDWRQTDWVEAAWQEKAEAPPLPSREDVAPRVPRALPPHRPMADDPETEMTNEERRRPSVSTPATDRRAPPAGRGEDPRRAWDEGWGEGAPQALPRAARVGPLIGPIQDDGPPDGIMPEAEQRRLADRMAGRPAADPYQAQHRPPPPWSRGEPVAESQAAPQVAPQAGPQAGPGRIDARSAVPHQGGRGFAPAGPPDSYLPPHLRAEPRGAGQVATAAAVLSRDDVHRMQSALYELGECRRLMEGLLSARDDLRADE